MNRPKSFVFVLLALIINMACSDSEFINPSPQDQLVVHSILLPSQPRQKVWVTRVTANDGDPYVSVNDVSVAINDVAFDLKDSMDWQDPYNFYSDRLSVIPGNAYTLLVRSSKYGEIKGAVTIPGDFEILTPGDSATIKWTKSEYAYGYIVNIIKPDYSEWFSEVLRDTLYHLPSRISGGWYNVEIKAFDKNYYSYMILKNRIAGIVGAFGMMAAIVRKEQTVYLAVLNS